MLVLMMLLLADFLGVRDVSWISHQLIDGSQRFTGRISMQTTSPDFAELILMNGGVM